jgi:hypothetical protein
MRAGRRYERDDALHAVARYLGFARVTDTVRQSIKSAINSGIRQGVLGYEGDAIWRDSKLYRDLIELWLIAINLQRLILTRS